jgi:hypothetical protein
MPLSGAYPQDQSVRRHRDLPQPGRRIRRSMRILRRGISRPDLAPGSTLPPPGTGVGLLFMCWQSRLNQFVIQQEGSDSIDFVKHVGPDATLGITAIGVAQQWPLNGNPAATSFLMSNFVTMLGGEYFSRRARHFLRPYEFL